MKKALFALLIAALVAAPAFAQFKVGLVTDVGGIDDKSFNQGTWEGIVRFAQDNKLPKANYKYLQSTAEADYVPNLTTFVDEKMNLIVAPGFLFNNAMAEVALKNPLQKFLIIDSVVADKDGNNIPNVANAVFAEHEGSFLVGVAAALKAKADKQTSLGFIGGMEVPLIKKFEAGFDQGVKAVDASLKVLVDYTGVFDDPAKGQALAQKQFNAGAYIIFSAAGACGNGVIKEAKERSQKGTISWAIGVDKDQYNDGVYGTKSAILTSMMKRVDVAAYEVAKMTMAGKFPGAQVLTFSLANDGVGIPAVNPNLSADIVAKVKDYASQIKSGKLKVSEVPAK